MILSFNEIYTIVEESSHETCFGKEKCRALYSLCKMIPIDGEVLEIGVQYGRSTTVLGMVAKEKGYRVTGVDNWKEDVSKEAKEHIEAKIRRYEMPVSILSMSSEKAHEVTLPIKYNLIHIDGDHQYKGIEKDCKLWKERVKRGGFLCFDDYHHPTLTDVKKAVDRHIIGKGYRLIGIYGNTLAVLKKI